MQKRRLGKKLAISKETLHRLEPGELRKAPGGAEAAILSWDSDCFWGTCGPNSCAGFCTLARCPDAPIIRPVDAADR